jgi:glycosyltransferase involved in cell wall biosynthesis
MTSLSVLVPVYNEEHLVASSLARLLVLGESPRLDRVQVIVVDDCSTDATPRALRRFIEEQRLAPAAGDALAAPGSRLEWLFLRHDRNRGKGSAIRTALARADCELSVIHDADLEYHPQDLLKMVEVFEEEQADAVFGSRFVGADSRRVLFFRHELGNRLLTFLTNLVTDLNVSDMETCYKAVRTDLLRSIPLVSDDFRLEPELTIKLAKREARLFEVPIRYSGRTYQEGKKIGWRDGVKALGAIARFAVTNDIYGSDGQDAEALARLGRAPRFNDWMAEAVRPLCGQRVLELGAASGAITRRLVPRERYVATDQNPLHLHHLRALCGDRPYLEVRPCDVTDPASFPRIEGGYDTVLALNVLEHVEDDRGVLENIRAVLAPGGRAVVLVPQGPALYGSQDELLGHRRRYTEESLRQAAAGAGFDVRQLLPFNRASTPAWWVNGKVRRSQRFSALQIAALDRLTPVLRRVDGALPFAPLSLLAAPGRRGAALRAAVAAGGTRARRRGRGRPGPRPRRRSRRHGLG